MNTARESVLKLARQLPATERAQLVDSLLSTLDKPDPEVEAAWLEESHRRLQEMDSGKAQWRDFDEVMDKLWQNLK
ncbi:MAG TPA: hypothetical protein EYH46_07265 [Sulfurivirga caldicuralii]|nr:hypothetical protein [Sulfurivirga caldicuralii]